MPPAIIGSYDEVFPRINGTATYLRIFRSPHTVLARTRHATADGGTYYGGSQLRVVAIKGASFLQIDTAIDASTKRRVFVPMTGAAKLLTAFSAASAC